jgi:putative peptidoglycan lipid II flippase
MAAATSIAGWVNVAMMGWILHRRGVFSPDALLKARLSKMLLASALLAASLVLTHPFFAEDFSKGVLLKTLALGSEIGIGLVVYGGAVLALRAYDVTLLKRLLRRR